MGKQREAAADMYKLMRFIFYFFFLFGVYQQTVHKEMIVMENLLVTKKGNSFGNILIYYNLLKNITIYFTDFLQSYCIWNCQSRSAYSFNKGHVFSVFFTLLWLNFTVELLTFVRKLFLSKIILINWIKIFFNWHFEFKKKIKNKAFLTQ